LCPLRLQVFVGKKFLEKPALLSVVRELTENIADYAAVANFRECIFTFLALNSCDDKICSALSSEK
jgi:hypothetical protein